MILFLLVSQQLGYNIIRGLCASISAFKCNLLHLNNIQSSNSNNVKISFLSLRIIITMLVSSFWHGVHPGYYLCLCSAPLFLFVEMEVEKAVRHSASYPQQVLFDWVWWVIKMQSFAYMGMAFLLLDIKSCFFYWKSIYFCGHVFIILMYLVAYYFNKKKIKTT